MRVSLNLYVQHWRIDSTIFPDFLVVADWKHYCIPYVVQHIARIPELAARATTMEQKIQMAADICEDIFNQDSGHRRD